MNRDFRGHVIVGSGGGQGTLAPPAALEAALAATSVSVPAPGAGAKPEEFLGICHWKNDHAKDHKF